MNYYFDEDSQKIIIDAKKEMFDLKHPYVGSEHLLLAILKHIELEVTQTLNLYNISYDSFRNELISVVGIGSKSNDWFLFTPLLKRILNNASTYSKNNNGVVQPNHLLLSIIQEGDGIASRILMGMNVDLEALQEKMFSYHFESDSSLSLLKELGFDMNEKSLVNSYDPVIGREEIIQQLFQILLRKNKNNPLLVGEAGVGKTAIVEELARRIAIGNVPYKLKNKKIYSISMSNLVAGTKYRGEFEEKLQKLIGEVKNNPNIVLFIDEVHTIIKAGGAEGAIDASNILKPYLARGEVHIIGATTIKEYTDTISKDKALDRRFHKIYVEETTEDEVYSILLEIKPIYEQYHNVTLSDSILKSIINISNSCLFFGRQPDKSIDLLDEVCSYVSITKTLKDSKMFFYNQKILELKSLKNQEIKNHNFAKASQLKKRQNQFQSIYNELFMKNMNLSCSSVSLEDIHNVIYQKVRFPMKKDYFHKMNILKKNLLSESFDKSFVQEVLNILKKYDYVQNNASLTFLFVFKNDVITPLLIDKIHNYLFSHSNYIHLNMNEYKDEQSLSKLIGTNPGYVGYQDQYIFQSIIENPFTIIFLENIEKTNHHILQFLLDSFDKGFFTNPFGEKVNLSKCIVFMTTNEKNKNIGFQNEKTYSFSKKYDKIKHILTYQSVFEEDKV